MSWLRFVIVLVMGLAGLLVSPGAQAITGCSADMTNLNFNLVDPSDRTAVATINYDCTTLFGGGDQTTIRMCFAIGGGTPPSTIADRRMASSGETLPFRIYKDPAHSLAWGDNPTEPSYLELSITYPLGFLGIGSRSGHVDVYGLIPNLSGIAAGNYSNFFSNPTLTYRYNDGPGQNDPKACGSGPGREGNPAGFSFTALATIPGSCTVLTATDMDFSPSGTLYASSTGNLASTSTIALDCTKRTAWQVGLDNGLHFDGTYRQMCVGSSPCIRYRLTTQAGQPWGNTVDLNTVPGSSTGIQQSLTVNGTVINQPLTEAGRYSDTIKVTLTY